MNMKSFCISVVLFMALENTRIKKTFDGTFQAIWIKIKCKVRCMASHQAVPLRADGTVGKICQDLKAHKHMLRKPGLIFHSVLQSHAQYL